MSWDDAMIISLSAPSLKGYKSRKCGKAILYSFNRTGIRITIDWVKKKLSRRDGYGKRSGFFFRPVFFFFFLSLCSFSCRWVTVCFSHFLIFLSYQA